MDKAAGAVYFMQVAAPLRVRAVCAMHQLPCFLQVWFVRSTMLVPRVVTIDIDTRIFSP